MTALRNGYNVRAVIRKAEQAEKLKSHSKIAPYLENLEFVVVPDLTKEGAFDDVLSDVVAILHIASPLAVEVCSQITSLLAVRANGLAKKRQTTTIET